MGLREEVLGLCYPDHRRYRVSKVLGLGRDSVVNKSG